MMPDIPEVAGVERMVIRPGEVLVVRLGYHLGTAEMNMVRAQFVEAFPGVRVIVLDVGVSMQVMRAE